MTEQLQLRVDPATAASELRLTALASTRLNIDANRIKGIRIIKRSIDARQRNVMINLTLLAYVDEDPSATLFAPEPYDRTAGIGSCGCRSRRFTSPDCSRLCGSYSSA